MRKNITRQIGEDVPPTVDRSIDIRTTEQLQQLIEVIEEFNRIMGTQNTDELPSE